MASSLSSAMLPIAPAFLQRSVAPSAAQFDAPETGAWSRTKSRAASSLGCQRAANFVGIAAGLGGLTFAASIARAAVPRRLRARNNSAVVKQAAAADAAEQAGSAGIDCVPFYSRSFCILHCGNACAHFALVAAKPATAAAKQHAFVKHAGTETKARQKYKQPCYPTKSEDSLELLGGDLALSSHGCNEGARMRVTESAIHTSCGVSDLICWKLRTDPELLELTDGADWPEVSVALRRVLEVVFNGEVWPPLNVSKDIVDGIEFDHFVQSVVEASKRPLPLGEDTLAASVESLLEEDTGRNVDKRVIRFYEHIRGLAVAPPPSSPDPDAAHAKVATYPSISEASSGLRSAASSSGSGSGGGGGSVQEQEDAFDSGTENFGSLFAAEDVVDEIDANEVASNSGIDDEDDLDLKFDSFDELLLDEAAQEDQG
ncbi:unnamed protein product, partial [Polarella glacialis]